MKHKLKQFAVGVLLLGVSLPVLFFIVNKLPASMHNLFKVS